MTEKSTVMQILSGELGLASVPNTAEEARLSAEFEQINAEFEQLKTEVKQAIVESNEQAQKSDAPETLCALFERAVKNFECTIVEVADNHFCEGFSLGIKLALELTEKWEK